MWDEYKNMGNFRQRGGKAASTDFPPPPLGCTKPITYVPKFLNVILHKADMWYEFGHFWPIWNQCEWVIDISSEDHGISNFWHIFNRFGTPCPPLLPWLKSWLLSVDKDKTHWMTNTEVLCYCYRVVVFWYFKRIFSLVSCSILDIRNFYILYEILSDCCTNNFIT